MRSLHRYQQDAIEWVLGKPMSALFIPMGGGKTIATLSAIVRLAPKGRVLVIAPLAVARSVWSQEAEDWGVPLRVVRVLGNEKQRLVALAEEADVYVINVDNVVWLQKAVQGDFFEVVVVDELSCFKNGTSARFKALRKMQYQRFIGLTGTPAPNGLINLWSQLYLIDRGERLGSTKTGFMDRYFTPDKRNGMVIYTWKPRQGAEQAIFEKIGDVCMSLPSTADVPPRTDVYHEVHLGTEARRVCREIETEMAAEVSEQEITAATAAVVSQKLLQLAGGSVYNDDGRAVPVHEHKLDALEELVEQLQGEPVLVFYWFDHERDRLLSRFPQAVMLKGDEQVRAFNEGRIPMLLAHPASAGHGLNLQRAANQVIWFALTWDLELYQQACARLHRQGQKRPVFVHHLMATNTLDEDVVDVLRGKAQVQDRLIEAVKRRTRA